MVISGDYNTALIVSIAISVISLGQSLSKVFKRVVQYKNDPVNLNLDAYDDGYDIDMPTDDNDSGDINDPKKTKISDIWYFFLAVTLSCDFFLRCFSMAFFLTIDDWLPFSAIFSVLIVYFFECGTIFITLFIGDTRKKSKRHDFGSNWLFLIFMFVFAITKFGSGYGNICELRVIDKVAVWFRFGVSILLVSICVSKDVFGEINGINDIFTNGWILLMIIVSMLFLMSYSVWSIKVQLNDTFYGVAKHNAYDENNIEMNYALDLDAARQAAKFTPSLPTAKVQESNDDVVKQTDETQNNQENEKENEQKNENGNNNEKESTNETTKQVEDVNSEAKPKEAENEATSEQEDVGNKDVSNVDDIVADNIDDDKDKIEGTDVVIMIVDNEIDVGSPNGYQD